MSIPSPRRALGRIALLALAGALASACAASEQGGEAPGGPDAPSESDCVFKHGSPMQRITVTGAPSFCIDETEVTRKQYAEFLASSERPAPASAHCTAELIRLTPDASCMRDPKVCQGNCDQHPQVCIGYCDAAAYCAWAGKSLCGGLSDGKETDLDNAPLRRGRWAAACAGGIDSQGTLKRDYPYGDSYEAGRCHGEGTTTREVGSSAQCGLVEQPKVRDLSGNVEEYNALFTENFGSVSVIAIGGDFFNDFDEAVVSNARALNCDTGTSLDLDFPGTPELGFRCCAD